MTHAYHRSGDRSTSPFHYLKDCSTTFNRSVVPHDFFFSFRPGGAGPGLLKGAHPTGLIAKLSPMGSPNLEPFAPGGGRSGSRKFCDTLTPCFTPLVWFIAVLTLLSGCLVKSTLDLHKQLHNTGCNSPKLFNGGHCFCFVSFAAIFEVM